MKKVPSRIAWHDGNVLHVVRLGKTTNAKIARPTDKVLQTYHFDLRQLALVRSHLDGKSKIPMSDFFDLEQQRQRQVLHPQVYAVLRVRVHAQVPVQGSHPRRLG